MSPVMGINHATSGAAVWLAATATLPALGTDLFPLEATGVLAGTLVCAGAALLPDADHHSGTIAHSVPVLGKLITRAVAEESGGHRHGAHTLLAAVLVGVGAVLLFVLAAVAPDPLPRHVTVFALAIVIGFYVIGNVHHALHTPLMSVTNAISGIIVVGALLQIGSGSTLVTALAFVATLVASINVFGGFAVTRRMLGMFTRG